MQERIHTKQTVEEGRDVQVGEAYICPVCGYTTNGEVQDSYTVSGAP